MTSPQGRARARDFATALDREFRTGFDHNCEPLFGRGFNPLVGDVEAIPPEAASGMQRGQHPAKEQRLRIRYFA
jgi:hypothetical protein